MRPFLEGIITIALAVIGLAAVAALISRKSNTAGVIQAAASGLGNTVGVALSPVTGSSPQFDLSYPGGSFGF